MWIGAPLWYCTEKYKNVSCNYWAFATLALMVAFVSSSPAFTLLSGYGTSSYVHGLFPVTDIERAGSRSSPDRTALAAAIFVRFRLDDAASSDPDVRDAAITETWRRSSVDGPPSKVWRTVAVRPGPPPTIVRTNWILGNASITVTAIVTIIFKTFPALTSRLLGRCSQPSILQSNFFFFIK